MKLRDMVENMTKKLLFSVTAKDCRFDFFVGSGDGGQKRQKTKSACRCTHIESGAVGTCQDDRKQLKNKQEAFRRMANTPEFKAWHKRKVAELSGAEEQARYDTEIAMMPHNLRTEVKDEQGNWKPVKELKEEHNV